MPTGDFMQRITVPAMFCPAVLVSQGGPQTELICVSEGGLQPSSLGFSPVHLIVYKVEPPVCAVPTT